MNKKYTVSLEEEEKILKVLTGDKEIASIEEYTDGLKFVFKDGTSKIIKRED